MIGILFQHFIFSTCLFQCNRQTEVFENKISKKKAIVWTSIEKCFSCSVMVLRRLRRWKLAPKITSMCTRNMISFIIFGVILFNCNYQNDMTFWLKFCYWYCCLQTILNERKIILFSYLTIWLKMFTLKITSFENKDSCNKVI